MPITQEQLNKYSEREDCEHARNDKLCEKCGGDGFIEKTEWSGDDDSYEVKVKCECLED